ncbi:MAG: flagellar export protein FliJ, partial [Clostridiales bacterium]
LETLLNLKNQFEKNIKNELGKEIQKLEKEKKIMDNYLKEKDNYLNVYNNKLNSMVEVRYIREMSEYLIQLKKRIEFQKKTINKFEKSVDIIRVKLIKIVREKKMLEKLKEKEFEKYNKEELKVEQKLNDEIASYKHIDKINN